MRAAVIHMKTFFYFVKGKGSRSHQLFTKSWTSLLIQCEFAALFVEMLRKQSQFFFIFFHCIIFTLHYMTSVLHWLCKCVCVSVGVCVYVATFKLCAMPLHLCILAIIYKLPNGWIRQRKIEITFISSEQCSFGKRALNTNDFNRCINLAENTFAPKARCKNDKVHRISEYKVK